MRAFDFKNLFVLDLANNHQGDLRHGLQIIEQAAAEVCVGKVRAAIKFQFRDLETFIHPLERENKSNKHIHRFASTRLSWENFQILQQAVRKQGLLTMCTPFDESSVQKIEEMNFDVIKVASCSADDWPLLERVAQSRRPVLVSTGGLSIHQIDRLVNFFELRNVDFAIMHCVAIYPTPDEMLNLNQVGNLKRRYPNCEIGWSTHEHPENMDPVKLAYAQGARIFERHIGLNSNGYALNSYSSTPRQLRDWFASFHQAVAMCGAENRAPAGEKEISELRNLKRGVYLKNSVQKGHLLQRSDVFFAVPMQEGQLISGEWSEGLVADRNYEAMMPLAQKPFINAASPEEILQRILLQVRGFLNSAGVIVNQDSSVEISHHFGLQRFREFGAVIIDCLNRVYCKKIIVQLPRQKHPYHFHNKKEETFILLWGDLEVELDGHLHVMKPGDQLLIPAGSWHKFHTLDGAVIEEISTTHYAGDSIYEDPAIARLQLSERKTQVQKWQSYFFQHDSRL